MIYSWSAWKVDLGQYVFVFVRKKKFNFVEQCYRWIRKFQMTHECISHENTCCKLFVAINIVFIDLYVLISFVWKCAFLKLFDFTTFKYKLNITNLCSMNCVDTMLGILNKKWPCATIFLDYVHFFKIPYDGSKHAVINYMYTCTERQNIWQKCLFNMRSYSKVHYWQIYYLIA